jgi:hypothetical protein
MATVMPAIGGGDHPRQQEGDGEAGQRRQGGGDHQDGRQRLRHIGGGRRIGRQLRRLAVDQAALALAAGGERALERGENLLADRRDAVGEVAHRRVPGRADALVDDEGGAAADGDDADPDAVQHAHLLGRHGAAHVGDRLQPLVDLVPGLLELRLLRVLTAMDIAAQVTHRRQDARLQADGRRQQPLVDLGVLDLAGDEFGQRRLQRLELWRHHLLVGGQRRILRRRVDEGEKRLVRLLELAEQRPDGLPGLALRVGREGRRQLVHLVAALLQARPGIVPARQDDVVGGDHLVAQRDAGLGELVRHAHAEQRGRRADRRHLLDAARDDAGLPDRHAGAGCCDGDQRGEARDQLSTKIEGEHHACPWPGRYRTLSKSR